MCGFAGELRPDGAPADRAAVERMAATMGDRGPDGHGDWAEGAVALGHRRLKIIDLSEAGHQPMVDEALGLAIVFNGCVYNHHELRAELRGHGYEFASTSDTEVILKAYARWGEDCVEHFRGMFAFALVRARTRAGCSWPATGSGSSRSTWPTWAARCASPRRCRRCSPAAGVDTAIDPVALHHYLSWHAVVPAPHTMLAGVRKLAARPRA